MTFKGRILAAWNGQPSDHVPLTTWCFGVKAPPRLRWERDGRPVTHWYSKRMEHIHTLPQPWTLEDDFNRALAWHSLGVDDILEVSVPWSIDPEVTWQDAKREERGETILVREYQTPSGSLRHEIRQTGEELGEGWVIQPDYAPLIEDLNIPRGVKHAVASPADVPVIQHLFRAPDAGARTWFVERMAKVKRFADDNDVPVQAWSAFGMDGVVWMAGVEGAILMAVDDPQAFGQLVDIVAEADFERTWLAVSTPGVDMVIERGWYSSTDFWSPRLFDEFVYPHVQELASLAHRHGKKFGYAMTTGVEILGPRLADAGVDVLYFVDPVQDGLPVAKARDLLSDRMTLVGGTNALSLVEGKRHQLCDEIRRAIDVLGPTHRFVLHPVDALFPDTPWEGVERMIECWQAYGSG
jgi:hypothetical protein